MRDGRGQLRELPPSRRNSCQLQCIAVACCTTNSIFPTGNLYLKYMCLLLKPMVLYTQRAASFTLKCLQLHDPSVFLFVTTQCPTSGPPHCQWGSDRHNLVHPMCHRGTCDMKVPESGTVQVVRMLHAKDDSWPWPPWRRGVRRRRVSEDAGSVSYTH